MYQYLESLLRQVLSVNKLNKKKDIELTPESPWIDVNCARSCLHMHRWARNLEASSERLPNVPVQGQCADGLLHLLTVTWLSSKSRVLSECKESE